MMDNVKYISYSDWSALISEVMEKGLSCDALNELRAVYPRSVGEAYDTMLYNRLAKLEQFMIEESVGIFQKQMTACLDEADLEIAENAFVKLKKHYVDCLFFQQIPDYPETVKRKMSDEIIRNMQLFRESFLTYLKKLEYTDNSAFIQDYVYICKRNMKKIKKYI